MNTVKLLLSRDHEKIKYIIARYNYGSEVSKEEEIDVI